MTFIPKALWNWDYSFYTLNYLFKFYSKIKFYSKLKFYLFISINIKYIFINIKIIFIYYNLSVIINICNFYLKKIYNLYIIF